jgi:hypothetical protein
MGHSRQGKPSSSNFLAALHSGLERAHEARAGPQMALWASPVLIAGIVPDEKLDGLGGSGAERLRALVRLMAQVDERNRSMSAVHPKGRSASAPGRPLRV